MDQPEDNLYNDHICLSIVKEFRLSGMLMQDSKFLVPKIPKIFSYSPYPERKHYFMRKEELFLQSVYDDLPLGLSIRIPEHPTGVIQFVHGMAEHRKRYHDLMEHLSQHGYITVLHDHRGHGDSVRSPQDYGYFYENGIDAIVEDVHQITLYAKERFPGLPVVLFGHSMGSMVVRCYMRQYDSDIDGLIVCGSPSRNPMARSGKMLVRLLKRVKGARYRSPLVQKMAFGSFNRNVQNPSSENAWICSDDAVVKAYDKDPQCGFVFTLNGFEALFGLMIRTYQKSGWVIRHPEIPILFIAGEQDPCIVSRDDFVQAVSFMKQRGYQKCDGRLYPDMRHEILNETGKETVWNDILLWIKEQRLYAEQEPSV